MDRGGKYLIVLRDKAPKRRFTPELGGGGVARIRARCTFSQKYKRKKPSRQRGRGEKAKITALHRKIENQRGETKPIKGINFQEDDTD